MGYPLGFWHRIFLPFYSPVTIARILSKKNPRAAVIVLESLMPDRTAKVLRNFEEPLKYKVLNQMSNYLYLLLKHLEPAELSEWLLKLQGSTVRRISLRLPDRLLQELSVLWNDTNWKWILTNVHPKKASVLLSHLPEEMQVTYLRSLQPWVQAALIKDLSAEIRAEVVEGLNLEGAIDLLTRWGDDVQSSVLRLVNKQRKLELLATMRPKQIADLVDRWPEEEKIDLLNSVQEKQMVRILFNLEENSRKAIFLMLPPAKQRYVIANLRTDQAVVFLRYLPEEEMRKIISELDSDTSRLLISHLRRR